jgi:transposase
MRQKSRPEKQPAEDAIKDIRRATRRHFSAEEKIRVVLEGLRGEESIAELCRREGIASSMYYGWSKEFLEVGKKRLARDTARAATSGAHGYSCSPLLAPLAKGEAGRCRRVRADVHRQSRKPQGHFFATIAGYCRFSHDNHFR